jgi:hypothetical protein
MARIKAWLLATRYTVRDYLDTVVLFERLGAEGVAAALAPFDDIYAQDSGTSPLSEVAQRLAEAAPNDSPDVDLVSYRGLKPPWNEFQYLATRGREWAKLVARLVLDRDSQGGSR